jgi:hypothetical protein
MNEKDGIAFCPHHQPGGNVFGCNWCNGYIKTIDLLSDVVADMVSQHCSVKSSVTKDGKEYTLDSMAISDNAEAMLALADAGQIEIVQQAGRRILARWIKKEDDEPEAFPIEKQPDGSASI